MHVCVSRAHVRVYYRGPVHVCVSHRCPRWCSLGQRVCAYLIFTDTGPSSQGTGRVLFNGATHGASSVLPRSPADIVTVTRLLVEIWYIRSTLKSEFETLCVQHRSAFFQESHVRVPCAHRCLCYSSFFLLISRNSLHIKDCAIGLWNT